ncbi:3',5'-cyclic-nucleotide phosphodiesterase [uncultured Candidatus Thioglobus sp.]|nr:3',5'-cyclic-nucleotide phosphodiesterase [uncultured Candidatus Thioglobus sp.]
MKHFIQISDCHIDDTAQSLGVDSQKNLATVVNKITTLPSDALLISGDLTHNGTLQSYKILKKILSPIQTDIFVIEGNHDNFEHLNAEFSSCLFTQFTLGLWDIISINSVQIGKTSGFVSQHALAKLDQQLSHSSAKYSLVVLHHPIVSMNSTWDDTLSLENPDDLFALLKRHPKIQAALFGHAHESAEFNKNGIKIIACPSTAVQFNHESRIGFNHYTLLDDGQLHYTTQWI